jgi:hypothetical protein
VPSSENKHKIPDFLYTHSFAKKRISVGVILKNNTGTGIFQD